MDIEAMKKAFSAFKPIPFPSYDGVPMPTFVPFREKGAAKTVEDIQNLQTRNTDIMICTYAKSGTHWSYEIISMLLRNSSDLYKGAKAETMLEAIPDLRSIDALPSPRVLDTHFQFRHLPRKLIEDQCKIVHCVRNPKDVCVSYYHHRRKDTFTKFEGTWDDYFEEWMSGKDIPYGTWYDYELGMEQAEKDHPGLFHTCYYEQIKKDPKGEIKKLADYLGVDVSEETIANIAEASSFENMNKNKFDVTKMITEDGKGFIYRKGQPGDWKKHFTVAQNERFDAQFKEKMTNSSLNVVFE